jgi:hypothetical protein
MEHGNALRTNDTFQFDSQRSVLSPSTRLSLAGHPATGRHLCYTMTPQRVLMSLTFRCDTRNGRSLGTSVVFVSLVVALLAMVRARAADDCSGSTACQVQARFDPQERRFVLSNPGINVVAGDRVSIQILNLGSEPLVTYTCKWDETSGFLFWKKTNHITKPVPVFPQTIGFGISDPDGLNRYPPQSLAPPFAPGAARSFVAPRPGRLDTFGKPDTSLRSSPHSGADCKPTFNNATSVINVVITRSR